MSVQSQSLGGTQQQQQLVISSHSPTENDQREFLKYYIDDYLTSQGIIPNQDEIDEMESVLFSVSFGKQEFHKKVTYQAFSAAISSQQHVQMVIQFINRKERIKQAKCKILAYRVNQKQMGGQLTDLEDQFDGHLNGGNSQSDYGNDNNDALLTEGFDDAGEEGSGQKLLHLLQKMGVENILIIVCVWHYRMQGQFGTDTYRLVLERAKDLLTSLHLKVLESEKTQQEQAKMSQLVPYVEPQRGSKIKSLKGINGRHALQSAGLEVTTKVYPSSVIPDKNEMNIMTTVQRKNYRPNNFLTEVPGYIGNRHSIGLGVLLGKNVQDDDDDQLEIELTEDEFNYAVKMTEHSIRRLTKAHIIELRNQVKPHPLIEKVMNMVCILRGCIAPNWTVAREMMSSMTFKMELMLMDVCQIKHSLIKRVIKILNNNQKQLTPDNLSQFSEGATILLTWIINLVKWNAGHTKYKFDENALGGHKIMNHALIARGDDYENHQDIIDPIDADQKANTYGLMIGPKTFNNSGNRLGQNDMSGQNKLQKAKKQVGAHINIHNTTHQKPGIFIQSKQMVFGASQKLQPNHRGDSQLSSKYHQQSSQFEQLGAQTLQNQLVKQYQNQQNSNLNEKQQIQNMIELLEADKKNNWEELRQRIPENEEEILRFLDTAVLEEQPTEVLVQLAQKLKERRTKSNLNDQSSANDLGLRDQEIEDLLEKAQNNLFREDLFVDYVERDDEDTSSNQPSIKAKKNDKLPPKYKQQLREGVKHMTKVTLGEKKDLNGKSASKLMKNLIQEDQLHKLRRLDQLKNMDDELAKRDDLVKAEKLITDEKKWYKEVVQKIDVVPEEVDYYEKLAVKPGFDFMYALINCEKQHLDQLRVNIPDTLYFNYQTYLISTDNKGYVTIKQSPKSKDFLDLIESRSQYDIVKNWTEPATVLRKATGHPCYQTVNLFNWKQTYEHIRNGPANRTMLQRYQKSFGDKLTLYRACVHPEEMVNSKGSGKYNFCYAINNKVSFRTMIDDNDKIVEEFEQLRMKEQQKLPTSEDSKSPRKLNNRFENRYLLCPFEVGSFDVYTYTGKTMSMIEKEAYKIFNFMEKAFEMKVLNVVTDWIRDEKGQYWFIGLKSFKLREANYVHKTLKPSAFDRELLAIEQFVFSKADFKMIKQIPLIAQQEWVKGAKRYLIDNEIDQYFFCEVCYSFVWRDAEQFEDQLNLAYLEYIPADQDPNLIKKVKDPKEKKQKIKTQPKNIRNNQRFRPKMYQWRIALIAHKMIVIFSWKSKKIQDVNPKLLESKGHPVYLQYKFGEYITKFQLSSSGQPIKYIFEKVKSQAKYSKNQPYIVAETEAYQDENGNPVEIVLSQRELVRVLKINRSNYQKNDLSHFFNNSELEFRVTIGSNWNNYVGCCKGSFLNFFTSVKFNRGTESHFTRNMIMFTDDMQGINLRMTIGLCLDNECDMSELGEKDLRPYLQQVYLPPESYFPKELALNSLPQQWMKLIREEPGTIHTVQEIKEVVSRKLYHPDGRPFTKMDYYRVDKYGNIENKLHATTVAQRAAGKQDEDQIVKSESLRNRSAGTPQRRALSIPEQIKQIQEKKKFKKRALVMPSQKVAFYKKNKLAQNIQDQTEKKEEEDLDKSKDSVQMEYKKEKFKLKDLFQDEGMYHSISEQMRKSFTLLKSASVDYEMQQTEAALRELDNDARFNQSVFDPQALKKIEIKNLRIVDPSNKEILKIIKQEKLEEERKQKELEELRFQAGLPPPGQRRGKTQAVQKIIMTREKRKSKKQLDEEIKKKLEEEHKIRKEKEDKKFERMRKDLDQEMLRNIRGVSYARFTSI